MLGEPHIASLCEISASQMLTRSRGPCVVLAEGEKNTLLAVQRTHKASSFPAFELSSSPLTGIGVVQLYILEIGCFSQSFGIGEQICWRKWGCRIWVFPF